MRKKVAFITVHVGFNFGSILQSIATAKVINSLDKECELINYIPDRVTYSRFFKKMFSGILPFFRGIISLPNYINNNRLYGSYLEKYCKVSKPIYDKDDFAKKCPKADYYITGSDQVWNSKHNEGFNDRYYFASLPKDTIKISFASSIGSTTLDDEEMNKIRTLLGNYKAISVREKSAKELLASIGLNSEHLLDPTFMLDRKEWANYMNKRIVKEKYLFIYIPYSIVSKEEIYKLARQVANEKNLKIITFSWNLKNEPLADKTVKFANPGDFLSLMHHADYVITNSFHGTAFSINLNKQFSVFMPKAYSTRINSIIDLCGLHQRVVTEDYGISDVNKAIDYDKVNAILDKERIRSIEFLKKSFE